MAMDDDSRGPSDETMPPWSAHPDWDDVKPYPVAAGEGAASVVEIAMDEQPYCRAAYLYACIAGKEISARVYSLTAQVIQDNPANYTAWTWRWRCLQGGFGDKESELSFVSLCALSGAKNYQLWNHRRRVALEMPPVDVAHEMRFAADCLARDPKNYHVWAHRQAVLGTKKVMTDAWAAEAALTAALIQDDPRNNSAWAQRAFILHRRPAALGTSDDVLKFTPGRHGDSCTDGSNSFSSAAAQRELSIVTAAIRFAADNGSPWAYLHAVLLRYESVCQSDIIQGSNKSSHSGSGSICDSVTPDAAISENDRSAATAAAFYNSIAALCTEVICEEPQCMHAARFLKDHPVIEYN